jgi:hypothetical protein
MAVTPTAASCAREAFRSFSWRQYAPLAPILAAQFLFLLLGLNMGSAWGMATAGAFASSFVGETALNYPGSLQLLPVSFSYFETVTFVLGGAVAIPFVVARVLDGIEPSREAAARRRARIRPAILATLVALGAAYGLILLWQGTGAAWIRGLIGFLLRDGLAAAVLNGFVSSAIAFAFLTLFVYVPVAAIAADAGPVGALRGGLVQGLRLFFGTYVFVFAFSFPALLVQLIVQLGGEWIAFRTRPENIAYLLFLHAALSSLAGYFVWSTATRRIHGSVEEA